MAISDNDPPSRYYNERFLLADNDRLRAERDALRLTISDLRAEVERQRATKFLDDLEESLTR